MLPVFRPEWGAASYFNAGNEATRGACFSAGQEPIIDVTGSENRRQSPTEFYNGSQPTGASNPIPSLGMHFRFNQIRTARFRLLAYTIATTTSSASISFGTLWTVRGQRRPTASRAPVHTLLHGRRATSVSPAPLGTSGVATKTPIRGNPQEAHARNSGPRGSNMLHTGPGSIPMRILSLRRPSSHKVPRRIGPLRRPGPTSSGICFPHFPEHVAARGGCSTKTAKNRQGTRTRRRRTKGRLLEDLIKGPDKWLPPRHVLRRPLSAPYTSPTATTRAAAATPPAIPAPRTHTWQTLHAASTAWLPTYYKPSSRARSLHYPPGQIARVSLQSPNSPLLPRYTKLSAGG